MNTVVLFFMGISNFFKKISSSRVENLKNNFSREKEKQKKVKTDLIEKHRIIKERFEQIVLDEDFMIDMKELISHFNSDISAKNKNYKCNYAIEKLSDGEHRLDFLKDGYAFCQGYILIKSNSEVIVGDYNQTDDRDLTYQRFNYRNIKGIHNFFLELITKNMSKEEPGLDK